MDNSISLIPNLDNIFTASELYPDPLYEKSWWEKNKKWLIPCIIVAAAALLTFVTAGVSAYVGGASVAASLASGAQAVGMMLVYGAKAAISGAVIGGVIGGFVSAISGNGFFNGFVNGMVNGFVNGFTFGLVHYMHNEYSPNSRRHCRCRK